MGGRTENEEYKALSLTRKIFARQSQEKVGPPAPLPKDSVPKSQTREKAPIGHKRNDDDGEAPTGVQAVLRWLKTIGLEVRNPDRLIPILVSCVFTVALFAVDWTFGETAQVEALRNDTEEQFKEIKGLIEKQRTDLNSDLSTKYTDLIKSLEASSNGISVRFARENEKRKEDIGSLYSTLNLAPDGFWVNEIRFSKAEEIKKIRLPLPISADIAMLKMALFPDGGDAVTEILKGTLYYRINSEVPSDLSSRVEISKSPWARAESFLQGNTKEIDEKWYAIFEKDNYDFQSLEFKLHSDDSDDAVKLALGQPISILIVVKRSLVSSREATEPPTD